MKLFGRRWDRWDRLVAASAVTLIVVSYQPWWAVQGTPDPIDASAVPMAYVWNAWNAWTWSGAVELGTLAAGVYLAYRGRPKAQGAALLAVFMFLVGVGLVGWQWHRSSEIKLKGLTRILTIGQRPDETSGDYQRRHEKEIAAAIARTPTIPTRSAPQDGIYVGAGSLIVMLGATARGLRRSRPSHAEAT